MNGSWDTAAGLRYLRIEPHPGAAHAPLIIALHGRGADPTDLAGLAFEISPGGYRWILPQGPLPVPFGPGAIGWAWYALGEDRSSTLVSAREQLARFVDEILGGLAVPRSQVAVTGFSQGGAMALHLGLSAPEPFGAVVAMSGYLPAAESLGDLASAPSQPILMVHGAQDQVLPVHLAREARDLMHRAGLALQYQEFSMGHQISAESLEAVRNYLQTVLRPEPGA